MLGNITVGARLGQRRLIGTLPPELSVYGTLPKTWVRFRGDAGSLEVAPPETAPLVLACRYPEEMHSVSVTFDAPQERMRTTSARLAWENVVRDIPGESKSLSLGMWHLALDGHHLPSEMYVSLLPVVGPDRRLDCPFLPVEWLQRAVASGKPVKVGFVAPNGKKVAREVATSSLKFSSRELEDIFKGQYGFVPDSVTVVFILRFPVTIQTAMVFGGEATLGALP